MTDGRSARVPGAPDAVRPHGGPGLCEVDRAEVREGGPVPADGTGGSAGCGNRAAVRVVVPIRTANGQNAREHWRVRAKRVKAEREAVGWALITRADRTRPAFPCVVTMTRVAPSNGLDSDNLSGAMKAIRDAVAEWFGVDDRDARIEWKCAQRRGPWAVEVEIA